MSVAIPSQEHRPEFGIALVLVAWFCFSLVDTGAKWLAVLGLPAAQLAFMRYAGHFAVSAGLAVQGGALSRLKTAYFWPLVLRSALLISATVINFYVLRILPLTVTSAIMFSSPIIVAILAWPMLGERIGPWRAFAIGLGFVGVLILIRPFGEAFHWAMVLVLYNATALALYSILTRKLAGTVSTEVMQFYMGLFGTVVLAPFAIFAWQAPQTVLDWGILISLGISGWAGHQLLTNAHLFAGASTLMPFTYTFLLYLTVLSYLVFDHIPDVWTLTGAGVIMISGLIIWQRERRI